MDGFDAIVIGMGSGGEGVSDALQKAGMKVAAIELELIGGLCAYWGCMPSKTLLRPGDIVNEAERGVGTSRPNLAWSEISDYRSQITRNWDDSAQAEQLRQAGIALYRGDAYIAGPGRVRIGDEEITAARLVIATGSDTTIPPIEGLKEAGFWTNREATSFTEVPKSVIVLGGGAIGCELAQVMNSFGTKVSIVEGVDHLLGRENPSAAKYLQKAFEERGIDLHLGRKASKVEATETGRRVTLDNGLALEAEIVLVATGRHARTEGYGLENLDLNVTKQGLQVDEHCRAGENVWAVGDVTGVAMYTHIAEYQSRVAVADILGKPRAANYTDIPNVTFTDPEIASVGITDPSHAPEGMDIVSAHVDLQQGARPVTYGKGYEGGMCLLANRKDKVLVGAWAAGPLAGEWIQWASLAIRGRVPLDVLDDCLFAFPTFTRLYVQPLKDLLGMM